MNQEHLCLTDLLDQDLSAYEYYQSLPTDVRQGLQAKEITSFDELQSSARDWKKSHPEVI